MGACGETNRSPTTRASGPTCEIVDWQERMHYIDDSTGMCAGLSSFPLKPPFHIHNLPGLISSGAGLDLDEEALVHLTRRNRNLVRANNLRRGMTERTRSLRRTTGRGGSPSSRPSSWTSTTSTKGGTTTGSRLARPCTSWIWTTCTKSSCGGGS